MVLFLFRLTEADMLAAFKDKIRAIWTSIGNVVLALNRIEPHFTNVAGRYVTRRHRRNVPAPQLSEVAITKNADEMSGVTSWRGRIRDGCT